MTRRIPVAIAAFAVVAALAAPASAGSPGEIEVVDNEFLPPKTRVDTTFDAHWFVQAPTGNEHNVLSSDKLFASAESASDLTDEVDYTISPSAGSYTYYCFSHGTKKGRGMAGELKVAPSFGSLKGLDDFVSVKWSGNGSFDATGNQYDVRWKGPGTKGKYRKWLKNTPDGEGLFGKDNEPTTYKPAKKYSIQVRSEASANPKKRKSGWSPALKMSIAR